MLYCCIEKAQAGQCDTRALSQCHHVRIVIDAFKQSMRHPVIGGFRLRHRIPWIFGASTEQSDVCYFFYVDGGRRQQKSQLQFDNNPCFS